MSDIIIATTATILFFAVTAIIAVAFIGVALIIGPSVMKFWDFCYGLGRSKSKIKFIKRACKSISKKSKK